MLIRQYRFMILRRTHLDNLIHRLFHHRYIRFALGNITLVINLHSNNMFHLTRHTFLHNPSLTRLQLRIDTNINPERCLLNPLNSCRSRRTLRTNLHNLLHRVRYTLSINTRIHNLRTLNNKSRGHFVLTKNTFLDGLLCTRVQRIVENNLGFKRNILLI